MRATAMPRWIRLSPSESGVGWLLGAGFLAFAVLTPVAVLAWHASETNLVHWNSLARYVLPRAFLNTTMLLAGVGVLVTIIGTGTAWLVTAYDFPGRRPLTWALLLPLAVPTYIIAFAYLDLMHPIGPVQTMLRWALGIDRSPSLLPDPRSLPGAIVLLGFVLYPYVYLTTRAMFMTQAASLLEAARVLGERPAGVFFRVALPLARPAIAVGVSLALLETLNDIGASEFLGVRTLTVTVYTTWIARSDLAGAAQIALTMLAIVVGLMLLERHGRARQRYASTQRVHPPRPRRLHGAAARWACVAGWLPVAIGFIIPAVYLAGETVARLQTGAGVSMPLLRSLGNTIVVATVATLVTVTGGLILAWAGRAVRESARRSLGRIAARIASLGYAVPGTVLAIGLLTPLTLLDHTLGDIVGATGLVVMGSMAGLVCAYVIRFLAIPTGAFEAGLARIPPSLEHASRLLGETPTRTLTRVHLPLLRPALAAAASLVFVDTMKELPATLLLRPLNFDTLATWLYAEAARGTYEEGAIAALLIVLAGLAPVIILARTNVKVGH